jgi:hypothetical protein
MPLLLRLIRRNNDVQILDDVWDLPHLVVLYMLI